MLAAGRLGLRPLTTRSTLLTTPLKAHHMAKSVVQVGSSLMNGARHARSISSMDSAPSTVA